LQQEILIKLRKAIQILFISLAVIMLQVVMLVPHHHHQEAACMITEKCEEDGSFNDQHTHHGKQHEDTSHSTCCVVKEGYIAPNISKLIKFRNSIDDDHLHFEFPCLTLTSNTLSISKPEIICNTGYGGYIPLHLSQGTVCSSGLRAPPTLNI
jgi:hypothetical protein